MKNTLMKSLIIVLAMVLSWLQGGAQVINSIGDENMKVEKGLKPQPQKN